MRSPGRRSALGAGAVALAVLVGAGFAFQEHARESWWLCRLESTDESQRVAAAERLGAMRSRRAVPRLVAWLRAEPGRWQGDRNGGTVVYILDGGPAAESLARIGGPAAAELARALSAADPETAAAILSVLARMGPDARLALPSVIERTSDPDEGVGRLAFQASVAIDPYDESTVGSLEAALRHPSERVREDAAKALQTGR